MKCVRPAKAFFRQFSHLQSLTEITEAPRGCGDALGGITLHAQPFKKYRCSWKQACSFLRHACCIPHLTSGTGIATCPELLFFFYLSPKRNVGSCVALPVLCCEGPVCCKKKQLLGQNLLPLCIFPERAGSVQAAESSPLSCVWCRHMRP